MDKRRFLKNATSIVLGSYLSMDHILHSLNVKYQDWTAENVAGEEKFWDEIRKGYRLKSDYINLENGYYCFLPESTLDHLITHIREVNFQGSYYMRNYQTDKKKQTTDKLADLVGCSHDELVITRNTTESLDTIINGYDWKVGDEAVMAEQDYGSIVNQFKLMSKRYGITPKIISLPCHPKDDDEIVELYEKTLTPKTRLLLVSHMVNITGQILPIKKICDMAHSKGVDVLVDGAHAIAHIEFNIKDLGCDYYGASLHKWLSAPLGSGLLYVNKSKIRNLIPTIATWADNPDDIKKLNHTGTHPSHTDLAINNAIDYYLNLGKKRKEERLRYLQRYWSDQIRDTPGFVLNTPSDPARSCGIANVGIEGMPPADMAKTLLEKYKIYTVAIDGQGIKGCRITPNIYTSLEELDQFVMALKKMV